MLRASRCDSNSPTAGINVCGSEPFCMRDRSPLNGAEQRRRHMTSALAGTLVILSIGILMAHAMDAFR